jgi:predicted RNase H-like HicB family nuclease
MNQISCKVGAFWDGEAEVWVATSEDVPGLATEAETLEALSQKLRTMVPELLQLNQVIPEGEDSIVTIELTSHRQELIQVAA